MRLVDILAEAGKFGFTKEERHEVAIRYRNAEEEFMRLQPPPYLRHGYTEMTEYRQRLEDHAALKARNYMQRKIDGWHTGEKK